MLWIEEELGSLNTMLSQIGCDKLLCDEAILRRPAPAIDPGHPGL
jgi:hypothetical protein